VTDSLDHARSVGIVIEQTSQFGNGPRQHLFIDDSAVPDGVEQFAAGDHLVRPSSQAEQDRHHARLDLNLTAVTTEAIQIGADSPPVEDESPAGASVSR